MEFNAESNSIEGNKKYNFYMDGGKKDKPKISLPNKDIVDLDGKRLIQMKQDNNVKSDEEYLREIKEVEDYNKNLSNTTDLSGYNFNGNVVVVRLYKQPQFKLISGLFVSNELVLPYQDKESGRIKTMSNPLQYQYRGVINYLSEQCSEGFKAKFKVGDVVDLKMGLNLMQQRTWLNPQDYYDDVFDNYFNINENMIEKGIKQ